MIMLRAASLAAAFLVTASIPALAQNRQIDQRQDRQEYRVQRALQSGELNRREARAIREEQWRIERMQRRAMSDGHMSPREEREIRQAQDRLSEMIRHASND